MCASLLCSLPLWFTPGDWIQSPVVHSRALFPLHSLYNRFHLPSPNSQPIPSPRLAVLLTGGMSSEWGVPAARRGLERRLGLGSRWLSPHWPHSLSSCSLASPALILALDVLGLGPGWYGREPMDLLARHLLFQREMTGLSQWEQLVC